MAATVKKKQQEGKRQFSESPQKCAASWRSVALMISAEQIVQD